MKMREFEMRALRIVTLFDVEMRENMRETCAISLFPADT